MNKKDAFIERSSTQKPEELLILLLSSKKWWKEEELSWQEFAFWGIMIKLLSGDWFCESHDALCIFGKNCLSEGDDSFIIIEKIVEQI